MGDIAQELLLLYNYTEEEGTEAIEFVVEFLEELVKHTEKTEPYATNSIKCTKTAINEVQELTDYL